MLAVLQALLVVFFSATKGIRGAFLCFVFLLPFMPRYLGVPVGTASISGVRIVLVFFLFILLLWLGKKSRFFEILSMVRKASGLFLILVLMFMIKIVSTLSYMGIENLAYVFDDFLASVPVALLTMMLFRTYESRKLLLITIVASLFVCELLSFLEFFKQAPLLMGLYEVDVTQTDVVLYGTIRDDTYRAQALFDSPLLFAEFICLAWPFAWYLSRNTESKILRRVFLLSLTMVPLVLFFIGTRGGWLVSSLTLLYIIYFYFGHRAGKFIRVVVKLFVTGILAFALYFAIGILISPEQYFDTYEAGGRSSLFRIDQFITVVEEVTKNPFGFGAHRSYEGELEFLLTLDSYWLRLLLEGGWLELLAFVTFFFLIYRKAYNLMSFEITSGEKQLAFALISSLLSLTLYKFFVSMPFNTIYMFIIAGVLMGWDIKSGEQQPPTIRRTNLCFK